MEDEIINISDSDDEAVPCALASKLSSNSSTQIQKQGSMTAASWSSSSSTTSSPSSNRDVTQSSIEIASGMSIYKPLGADLNAARQLEALKKKKLPIMQPFPVVRDVVNKMRSALGTNNSQLNVLGLAQKYITSLKYYQASIINCPNRCRLLARHIQQTMCLIRDLSRHSLDSPHYSQKMCEILAIYIHFEIQCAGDFKDSKSKIAERIIHNIHLHLENSQPNFVLRIFSFLANMGKEHEIATKVFQRLIPEPTIMVKNEFPDRLFIQYLIVFYHWKESWTDYDDQQKVVAFANKFMKPMSTIKTNKIYAKHLPCYVRRDDATGYFLTNMVFFNDLRNASILDGIQENGPALVDLSEDEKVYPIIDLADYTMEKVYPLLNVKTEPREVDETVDLTSDDNDLWIKKLICRAVALKVILPARLTTRKEDEFPVVIELIDSDNENARNGDENEGDNENEEDDDSWAFGPRNEQQQPQGQEGPAADHINPPADEESNSMDEIYNELNSSIDFGDDSTTESEIERKKEQKERFDVASKLTDAQARITFDGVVEKELNAIFFQKPTTSQATAGIDRQLSSKAVAATTSNTVKSVDQPIITNMASVSETPTSSKVVVSEKTTSIETVEVSTKIAISPKAAEINGKSNLSNGDAAIEQIFSESASVPIPSAIEEPTLYNSEAIQEVEKNPFTNEKSVLNEPALVVVDQEVRNSRVEQTLNGTIHNLPLNTELQETQAPKESVTFSMDDTLLSSFDSSDESDEDFIGRFQQPPFKTYLRRAHRRSSKKSTKNNASSSEEDANANVEKLLPDESESNKRPTSPTLPSNDATNENSNVLFSGKVISLREDESSNGAGGATPNYLNIPESVELSKQGSNVVFSMQGRRLSSFPSLKVASDQGVPDFDVEISMTGEEDSNSRTDEMIINKNTFKKSIISSNIKNQNSSHSTDKQPAKAKSVWFAERPQVREIECRNSTSSQQKLSTINSISSTINKISANKQHFASKIFSLPSTKITATLKSKNNNLSESNKISKLNHLTQNRITTTESSPATAALKSAQEKGMQNFDSLSKNKNISSIINNNLSVFNDNNKNNAKQLLKSSSRENISLRHPNLSNTKTIIENEIEKQLKPHCVDNIISEMDTKNATSSSIDDTNLLFPYTSPFSISDFEKKIIVPDDDNRTDDVLAAAEILANGIGFPTNTPIIETSDVLKETEALETPQTTTESAEKAEGSKSHVSATPALQISSETPPQAAIESESAEENLLLNEVIAELEISTDFPQSEIAEALIYKDKNVENSKETDLTNEIINENTKKKKVETPIISEFSIMIPKLKVPMLSLHEKKVETIIESEAPPEILTENCPIPNPVEKRIEIPIETETSTESLNKESPIVSQVKTNGETPITAEIPVEGIFSMDAPKEKRAETPKETKINRKMPKRKISIPCTLPTIIEIADEKSAKIAKEIEIQSNIPSPVTKSIGIQDETKIEIEFVNTQSPMVNLDETALETEVAIALPKKENSSFAGHSENSVENPIEIGSIDFLHKDRILIPSPGVNRDETPIEFEIPNEFPITKNPMLSHGRKSTLENPIEIDVPNEFCKKRASMLSPGDSDCSLSLLEQIDNLLTPLQRSDSVDEFELFRAFSPSNAKRILGEAAQIPLPLKKRRKLSEYSEENIQYKEEDDCSESIDLDGVLNLKILPKAKQPTTTLVLPSALVKNSALSDVEQKEISYPSEPMLSIAHFEEEEYKEISKELNFNKRQYPPAAPPKYSEVMRDFQPIVAHQQTQFRPPELQQQLVQVPQVRPAPPIQPAPQIPTVQTINIGYPIQNPYMGPNNTNKPSAYPTTTIRIDSGPSGSSNNIYPGTQPVNLANVNMDYSGHTHPIQITQTLCTPQSCLYNQRPPPTPTPEHVTKDFDIHSLLNLQNYDLNQTYLNNFLHNRQFNYQAGKSIMNNSFCNQSECLQQNEKMQMLKNRSMSGSHQCSAHTSRRSIIPKCGLCPACKELVAEMIVTYNTELPQMRSNSVQRQQEHRQQQELQQMRTYNSNSQQRSVQQEPATTLPKKRGRPRKMVTPPLPTNRVTRSANRANQKKKEELQNEYYAFNSEYQQSTYFYNQQYDSSATSYVLQHPTEDLLQILFPEAFSIPTKPDRKKNDPKTPVLIKAAISSSYNSHEHKKRRESVTQVSVFDALSDKNEHRRISISTGSDKQSHSDFDKYLERKKLLKPLKQTAPPKTKNVIPKTEKAKTKRPRKSKQTKALIANDPKLSSQMKPVVVLNHVSGPVFILGSGISRETYREISPGVFKLKQSQSPMVATKNQTRAIRTKSLSDILSDVVVQEMTAAAGPKGKEILSRDDTIPVEILADGANVDKQTETLPAPVAVSVMESLQLQEKEKEEEGKIEQTVQPEIVPLNNAAVKSQDELELKQIKKEEMELKSSSPEVTSNAIPSKQASDCFKKPLKSMAQKRLASASFIHGTTKHVQAPKSTPISYPVRQETAASSLESVPNRQEIQEPVTSTNSHLFPPLTSESESDSSCRIEQTGDMESSEQSDSSQTLVSPRKNLKVRLRRHTIVQKQLEYSIVSNSVMDEMKSKAADGARKRRGRKSLEKKGEALKRRFERADSSTSSAPPKNLDQQPPQSGLINGVLVPSIEAMNTPPPTPPTTVDDKGSVADDTSQEAKSQTAPEPSNVVQIHPPVIYENGENVHDRENNIDVVSLNIPPTKIHENGENLQVHANQVFNFKSSPGQRRRFESLSLPSKNQKRPRKKSTAEASDDISSKGSSRSQLKKRRKTICTDVFNPPDTSSDEEKCSSEAAADSPTLDTMQMYILARGLKPTENLSKTLKKTSQEPSSVKLNNEEISASPDPLCDSSRLSPTFAALNPTSTSSTPGVESEKINSEGSLCRSRLNCDSPLTTSGNLAVSRTYSKRNMVTQVFVPPEIEMFIEDPNKLAVEIPTPSISAAETSPHRVTQRKTSCSNKTKKARNKFTTTDEEEEDDSRDKDYQEKTRYSKRGRKRGAPRGRHR